jgi:two-component sensor histidine kinase
MLYNRDMAQFTSSPSDNSGNHGDSDTDRHRESPVPASDRDFLVVVSDGFISIVSDDEAYRFARDCLVRFFPGTTIVVSRTPPSGGSFTVAAVEIPDHIRKAFHHIHGSNPKGLRLALSTDTRQRLLAGRAFFIPLESIHDAFFSMVPERIPADMGMPGKDIVLATVGIVAGEELAGFIAVSASQADSGFDASRLEYVAHACALAVARCRSSAGSFPVGSASIADIRIREMHHRVKNDLQIVSSLLGTPSPLRQDPKVAAVFDDVGARIRAVALVHDMLYAVENSGDVDMAVYLRNIAEQIERAFRPKEGVSFLELALDSCRIDPDQAILVGIIVNELVTNSFRHGLSFGETDHIRIAFGLDDGSFRLEVGDSGKGLPAGFDPKIQTSFGFRLVAALALQLGGSLDMIAGNGAAFVIRFPVKEG